MDTRVATTVVADKGYLLNPLLVLGGGQPAAPDLDA